jgi:multicomponent Na+:H+ antiporter subunit D
MSAALSASVAVPLLGALAALVAGRRAVPWIALTSSAVSFALAVVLAVAVTRDGVVETALGGWDAPVGIVLRADGLTAGIVLLVAVVGTAITVAAAGDLGPARGAWARHDAFWPRWLMLWASLVALTAARDIFSVYVALELMTLAAVGLIIVGSGRAALLGAQGYLLAAWLGATAYLLGVALVYADAGVLDMVALSSLSDESPAMRVALALMTAGLLLKAALVPLHFWLPRAHASAPPPASAALSGLVVTGAFVVLLRLWSEAMAGTVQQAGATLIGALGVAAILWGGVLALRQTSLKRMVAYSTVAQIGYLFLLIPMAALPLARDGAPTRATLDAWTGGTYYAVAHGVAKAALFLAAGCMVWAVGADRIGAMRGLSSRMPMVTAAFAIAGVALVGLPPTGGFVAKWYLISGAIRGGEPWWALAVLGGSLLTAGYVLMVVRVMFARPEAGDAACAPLHAPRTMQVAALALALVCLLIGLRPEEGIELLAVGIPQPADPAVIGAVGR